MRKFLGLLMLVPFAAILVLSCDEHPTAPENAQAATTALESSTPLATKAPPLPVPVLLNDVSFENTVEVIGPGLHERVVSCPEGTVPLSGGVACTTGGVIQGSQPSAPGGEPPYGWAGACQNETTGSIGMVVSAICVSAASPK